jgi:hypothetical protein
MRSWSFSNKSFATWRAGLRVVLILVVCRFGFLVSGFGFHAVAAQESSDVVAIAQQYLGTPYVWAGNDPSGFDCSGLVQHVYAQVGVTLPHNAAAQARSGAGTPIAVTDLAPGDLVFFDFTGAGIGHVALYAGQGWMIHAPAPGSTVQWAILWHDPWWSHAVSGLRIGQTVAVDAAPTVALPIVGPPSLSRETYTTILCTPRNGQVPPPCPEAGAMYDLLVTAGLDPAVELAFAMKETELGTTGPGRPPQRNLHNLECNGWDGGTCDGPHHDRFSAYPSYEWATWAWATLLLTRGRYVDAGNATVEQVLPIYAPPFENDTAGYIATVRRLVADWRGLSGLSGMSGMSGIGDGGARTRETVTEPIPDTRNPIPVDVCGTASPTQDAPRHIEPRADADSLGTLTPLAVVMLLCRADEPVTTTSTDGTTWQMVSVRGDVAYTWMNRALLARIADTR